MRAGGAAAGGESFEFGDYRLDARRSVLLRDDAPIALSPKTFDVLSALVRRAGRLVSKDELIEAVWPGEVVNEANLAQQIFLLRRALRERSRDHLYIVTVPGKGYRFVAPVRAAPAARAHPASENLAAYQEYVKGRYALEKRDEGSFYDARRHFEAAAMHDPSFAAAHAGVAKAYFLLAAYHYLPPAEGCSLARDAAMRALDRDPRLGEAQNIVGAVSLFFDWDFPRAEALLARAVAEDPLETDALDNLTWLAIARLRLDEALACAEAALAVDPSSLHLQTTLGLVLLYRGEPQRAASHFRALLEMDEEFVLARYYLGTVLLHCGSTAEGVAELRAVAAVQPSVQVRSSLAYAYAVDGRTAAARSLVEELRALETQRYVSSYSIAIPLVGLGDRAGALAALERAYAERSPWMIFLGVEPRFDVLRSDRRFARLIDDVGIGQR